MEFEKKLKAEEEERRKVREEERKKFEQQQEQAKREKAAKDAEEKALRERKKWKSAKSTSARGVDVTELGIDPEYLAALPEEFREEVIAQTVSTRRSQARDESATGEQGEVFQEFLDALPEDLRLEIVQQERQEARRRERDEQRRQVATAGQDQIAVDMDPASILLTFPPSCASRYSWIREKTSWTICLPKWPPKPAYSPNSTAFILPPQEKPACGCASPRCAAGRVRRNCR
ncbi:E3 ubiquitin-protein ligase [Colletotrichum higginsianum]|nr:E3 ubiquitin-protein ligase [Colletotrichum higginsianum]